MTWNDGGIDLNASLTISTIEWFSSASLQRSFRRQIVRLTAQNRAHPMSYLKEGVYAVRFQDEATLNLARYWRHNESVPHPPQSEGSSAVHSVLMSAVCGAVVGSSDQSLPHESPRKCSVRVRPLRDVVYPRLPMGLPVTHRVMEGRPHIVTSVANQTMFGPNHMRIPVSSL